MNILLFGVSCVGKTTIGELLASRLNWDFYNLDDEVKESQNTTAEGFIGANSLSNRDRIRCRMVRSLSEKEGDKVIAVTPVTYLTGLIPLLSEEDVLAIELTDSPENIFSRLVFSDEEDNAYTDDEYKNSHREEYLQAIREDQQWYGKVNRVIENKFDINGDTPEEAVERLMKEYNLKQNSSVE